MPSGPERRTYLGRCHCGAVRFQFQSEPITEGRRCNCSLCIRRGAVMSPTYYGADDFVLTDGRDALRVYNFGDLMMNHYFCATCGIFPFSSVIEEPVRYRVNLGCVDDLDPLALPIEVLDGRSF
jgi:hypothetical protein